MPVSEHAAGREPRRDARAARRRHACLPRRAAERRRRGVHGLEGADEASARTRAPRRCDRQLGDTATAVELRRSSASTHEPRLAKARRRARTSRAWSTTSSCSATRWRRPTASSPRSWTPRTRTSRRSPRRTPRSRESLQAAAAHPRPPRTRSRRRTAWRRAGRLHAGAAARRARARTGADRGAPVPREDHADHQEPAASVRARRAAPGEEPAPRGRGARADYARTSWHAFKVLNALLDTLAYNPPGGGRGLPLLRRLAEPQRRVASFTTQDATGRSAAACCAEHRVLTGTGLATLISCCPTCSRPAAQAAQRSHGSPRTADAKGPRRADRHASRAATAKPTSRAGRRKQHAASPSAGGS